MSTESKGRTPTATFMSTHVIPSFQIHASDVDFWAHEETELEVMESTQVRPPCFTVRVHGEDATAAAVAHVSFVGVAEELSTEVVLPVRAKNRGSRAEGATWA